MIIQAKPDLGSNLNHLVSTDDTVEQTLTRTLPAGTELSLEGVNSLVLGADSEVELTLTEPHNDPFVVLTKSIVFTNNQRSVRILAIVDTTVKLAIGYKKTKDNPPEPGPEPEPEPEPGESFNLTFLPVGVPVEDYTPSEGKTYTLQVPRFFLPEDPEDPEDPGNIGVYDFKIRFTPDVDLPVGTRIVLVNGNISQCDYNIGYGYFYPPHEVIAWHLSFEGNPDSTYLNFVSTAAVEHPANVPIEIPIRFTSMIKVPVPNLDVLIKLETDTFVVTGNTVHIEVL